MKITLRVDVDGRYWSGGACFEVPELYQQQFMPVNICDDPMLRYGTDVSEAQAGVVMAVREDAAKVLAEELAKHIVMEMERHDKHSGYPKPPKPITVIRS